MWTRSDEGRHWIWVNSFESQTRPTVWLNIRLHPYHKMGLLIPNRSVEEHRAFLVLAFSGEEKTDTSLNCQSVNRRRRGEVFLARDWLCIGNQWTWGRNSLYLDSQQLFNYQGRLLVGGKDESGKQLKTVWVCKVDEDRFSLFYWKVSSRADSIKDRLESVFTRLTRRNNFRWGVGKLWHRLF